MKQPFSMLLGLLASVVALGLTTPAAAQVASELPTDSSAVFRTIVPHQNGLPTPKSVLEVPDEDSAIFSGFSGSPYAVGAAITPTSTVPEGEEHIAVDPNNFNNLIAMISDFSQNGGFNTSKFAFSSNNGASWAESFVPRSGGLPVTADKHKWQANSDPVVAIDKQGDVFLANLYLQVDSSGNVTNDGYYVCSAKLSSGPRFTSSSCHPVKTSLKASTNLEDKEWLAVDNSSSSFSGHVYASWTHFTASSDLVLFSRSTNHGATWSKAIQINPASQNGAVQGSQIAVGPAGSVYVAYEVFLSGGQGQHWIAKSTNGGVSFGKPVPMTPAFNNLSFAATYRDNSFPALAVSPVVGKAFLYDVYTDQPGTSSRTAFVSSKTSGGLTFHSPVTANNSSKGQRLMPAVAADGNGVVHISWFDTRNSGSSTDKLDIYATYTKNNGTSFAPNAKVTSTPIVAGGASFIGDYSGVAAGPNSAKSLAHPVWTNGGVGGTTNGQMRTATLTVP
jgi:hypothetical protein